MKEKLNMLKIISKDLSNISITNSNIVFKSLHDYQESYLLRLLANSFHEIA